MAWTNLKSAIDAIITTNAANAITGALLNQAVDSVIDNVGEHSTFIGIATPSTNPSSEDGNVFYLASTLGTYSNFGGLVISVSGLHVLSNATGSWADTLALSYSGTIGASVTDAVNGGTMYNDFVSQNQKRTSFLEFSGAGYAKIPVNRVLFPSTAWTIELVIHIDTATGNLFLTLDAGMPNIYFATNKLILREGANEILTIDVSGSLAAQHTWLITYDGAGGYATFKDGVSVSHTLVSGTVLADVYVNDWYVGGFPGSSAFDGKISSIRIWTLDYGTSAPGLYDRSGAEFLRTYKGTYLTVELLAKNSTETNWYDTSIYETKGELTAVTFRGSQMPNTLKNADLMYLDTIPSILLMCVGSELNIWYDSIIPHYNQSDYRIEVIGGAGENKERSFRYTPSIVRNDNMTLNVYGLDGQLLKSVDFTIAAVARNTGTGTKQVLFIGDSTTDSYLTDYLSDATRSPYEMLHEFSDMVTADGGADCLFLGTRGVTPYFHEAVSGYAVSDYLNSNSPFWEAVGGRNDFKQWMADNLNFGGIDDIDLVCIQLGINDLKSLAVTPLVVLERMQTLIDAIHDTTYGYPTARIIISMSPYLGGDRTAWAVNFGALVPAEGYISAMLNLATLIKERFDYNSSNPLCYVAPNLIWTDRQYGYPHALEYVSARNQTDQEQQFVDSVHPNKSGYHQCADSYYGVFRALAPYI